MPEYERKENASMKLNPDCIRDILLTIEANTDYYKDWNFDSSCIKQKPLNHYTFDEVIYHISQCNKTGLIDGCQIYLGGSAGYIQDLSPLGHRFLADIRSDSVWNGVKSVAGKIGSTSLDALIQIASNTITELIKAQFGITS